ncbi:hypothetical protein DFH07DRAFT_972292 [Mycena maculata]|uniref:Uncharacterized protein n=1 Tax=Mycena maculata TaxID=230809 RepID=A0AAD7HIH1_9AGAR|nr:hypothetical protein DFH07DRAFT_972292 [Mycena maculata]
MPVVPSVMQIFGPGNGGQQGSPTATHNLNSLQRSPPNSRLLPSPPHPAAPHEPEREITPPHPHNAPNVNYPRPINRVAPPQFLTKLDENWHMTDELMAEIERADLQQAQTSAHSYPRESPPKLDPAVERLRAAERVSPKNLDSQGPRRQPLRESPKSRERERQPNSPTTSSFAQAPRTPDAGSPAYHTPLQSPGDHEYSYNPYHQDHGSPSQVSLARRTSNAAPSESRPVLLAVGTHGQTPPLQVMSVNPRTPDRSLPVQEEQEDEVPSGLDSGVAPPHDHYGDGRGPVRSSSPTPSSDLNPDADVARYEANLLSHGGRDSRAGHREEDDDTLIDQDLDETVHARATHAVPDEEGGFTPRSPQSGLPPDHALEPDRYPRYAAQNATIRARTRNGPTDQLGLHGFDPAIFAHADKVGLGSDLDRPPPQYVEQRRDARDARETPHDYEHQQRRYDPRAPNAQPVYIHPDDVQHYMDHPTMQSYFNSPRPDAPIPPTPHSQTAAPSPSPLTYDARKDYPPFSPIAPAGSPYPYPFNHVRRNLSYPFTSRAQVPNAAYDPNHPSSIQEQLARQWQVYAQNQSALAGHVSDSTFSPAATPFQGQGTAYNPWAYLHTNRTLGGAGGVGRHDLRSMQSSPSHEPVALPIPPTVGVRKKDRPENARLHVSARKPPPRVESTQPRSTPEPDPDSSGEETAGEPEEAPRFAVPEEGSWVGAAIFDPSAADEDWVDEEDDGDEEDLLELEYHPTFVSNVEKRRRRWETRWDTLVQAFNALDRQTDATLVLLAAPSHSTKLYSLTSRSIKRHPLLSHSPAMANVRVGFKQIAAQRRATRSHHSSLADRFLVSSNSSGDGSDDSPREEDLKRALGTALGSLSTLKGIYEQREARWAEEMRRISDDRERVELLLRQVLGEDPVAPGRTT